jgi:DNA helicase HerA-like ATPase
MPADPTYLGTVQDVRGATVSVALDVDTLAGLAFIEGAGYRIGQVGSFVRIPMGYVDLFGVVSQVGAGAVPERLADVEPYGHRWMTVQLLGEGPRGGSFSRGLGQYPTVGDPVHLVTDDDLAAIYGRADSPNFVEIGRLASAEAIPALVDVNRLLSRHSAVLGATGTGKSTFVAGLITELSNTGRFPNARIVVLDIHGEYAKALRDRATVFRVNPEDGSDDLPLHIPYWAMTFDELQAVTMGRLDDASHGAVLERVVALRRESLERVPREGVSAETLTGDTPIPFSIHQLWLELHELVNATHTAPATGQSEETRAYLLDDDDQPVDTGNALTVRPPRYRPQVAQQIFLSGVPLNIRRQLEALASRLRDPRYDFLFRPGDWLPEPEAEPAKDLDDLLRAWVGGSSSVAILDLSGIPSSILVELVGALLRIIYDALFWARNLSEGGRRRPLLLILEEAHAYLGAEGTGSAAVAVRRIVKEGRKYGIGAMIVSQRPAEIDPTILSQCGTTFALRLANSTDRSHVTATVSDNLEGLLAMLPILRTGEVIAIGEAVPLPLRMLTVVPIAQRPDSDDPLVYDPAAKSGWNREVAERDYPAVARAWRALDTGSEH